MKGTVSGAKSCTQAGMAAVASGCLAVSVLRTSALGVQTGMAVRVCSDFAKFPLFAKPSARESLPVTSGTWRGWGLLIIRLPHHISDPAFAAALVNALLPLLPSTTAPAAAAPPASAAPPPPQTSEPASATTTPALSTSPSPTPPLSTTLNPPPALDLTPDPLAGRPPHRHPALPAFPSGGREGDHRGRGGHGDKRQVRGDGGRGPDCNQVSAVGLYDGSFRTNLEETNMGYPLEVAMIKTASLLGFLTTPYAFNEEEARSMAGRGGGCGGSAHGAHGSRQHRGENGVLSRGGGGASAAHG
ncbi:unnamed protein product [Closterium sp. Naga37s-1]|nr:unnamed protein product [Closterium sp. Naga37s-1]